MHFATVAGIDTLWQHREGRQFSNRHMRPNCLPQCTGSLQLGFDSAARQHTNNRERFAMSSRGQHVKQFRLPGLPQDWDTPATPKGVVSPEHGSSWHHTRSAFSKTLTGVAQAGNLNAHCEDRGCSERASLLRLLSKPLRRSFPHRTCIKPNSTHSLCSVLWSTVKVFFIP